MAKETIQKDIVIIGAGMAGLTAALYAARAELSVLVLENGIVGGQIANAAGIENYPGMPNVQGSDLIATLVKQAESFGAVLDEFDAVKSVRLADTPKRIETDEHIYEAKAVIIATGMNRRKLPLAEAAKYENKGVHYCELCDGHLYKGKIIAVAGGGNAALDAANFLAKYAAKLYLIHRSELRADKISQQRFIDNEKAVLMLNTDITALKGDGRLEAVEVFDKAADEKKTVAIDGLFVNIGVAPNTELFKDEITLGATSRIVTDENCRTNIDGVFAAGDIREKEIRQLTTAAADGTIAALAAEKFIRNAK